jgi:hypothetical protein
MHRISNNVMISVRCQAFYAKTLAGNAVGAISLIGDCVGSANFDQATMDKEREAILRQMQVRAVDWLLFARLGTGCPHDGHAFAGSVSLAGPCRQMPGFPRHRPRKTTWSKWFSTTCTPRRTKAHPWRVRYLARLPTPILCSATTWYGTACPALPCPAR